MTDGRTEAERPEDEKQDRDSDKKWPRGSCDSVSAAFYAFETSKDEGGARKGHDSRVQLDCTSLCDARHSGCTGSTRALALRGEILTNLW